MATRRTTPQSRLPIGAVLGVVAAALWSLAERDEPPRICWQGEDGLPGTNDDILWPKPGD